MKKKVASALGGAVATAAIPASLGVLDWRMLAVAAVLGGVGGFFGVNVPAKVRQYMPKQKGA